MTRYRCTTGTCGAMDCDRCYPGRYDDDSEVEYDDRYDDEDDREYDPNQERTVTGW